MMIGSPIIWMLILMAGLSSCVTEKSTFHQNKVIAHRGAWKTQNLPQNSLASLQQAIDIECEGSEFDVWMTADGELVVNHDADYEGLVIEKVTYEQLMTKRLSNGEKIPTAEEYIRKGITQTGTKLIFEIKPSKVSKERGLELAEKSVALVRELGAQKWVDYITFDYDMGLKVIELDPEANVAYLNGDKKPSELKKDGFFGLDYNIRVIREKPHWIQECKNLDLTVNVWTVNNKEDMQWLLEQDVDFITTDEPEMLLELVKRR